MQFTECVYHKQWPRKIISKHVEFVQTCLVIADPVLYSITLLNVLLECFMESMSNSIQCIVLCTDIMMCSLCSWIKCGSATDLVPILVLWNDISVLHTGMHVCTKLFLPHIKTYHVAKIFQGWNFLRIFLWPWKLYSQTIWSFKDAS